MQVHDVKMLIVDRADYNGVLYSIYGLSQWSVRGSNRDLAQYDLIIDRDTGKILKSRYF